MYIQSHIMPIRFQAFHPYIIHTHIYIAVNQVPKINLQPLLCTYIR